MKSLCSFKTVIVFMVATFGQPNVGIAKVIERSQAAVTSPADLEDLYVRIKKRSTTTYLDNGPGGSLHERDYKDIFYNPYFGNPYTRSRYAGKEREYDLEDKSEICFRIFSSGFFEWFDEEAVQFDLKATDTMETLAQRHPDIYNDIYQGWPNVPRDQWLNPIEPRYVSVGVETMQEKVFTCLTRKGQSEPYSYTQYLVSPIYESRDPLMIGRFIFKVNENNEMKLFALAEEVAIVDNKILEQTFKEYFDKRNYSYYTSFHSHLGSKPDVCNSSVAEKIRLCAIILNATGFPDKIKFLPTPDHVEPACEKNKVWTTVKNLGYYGDSSQEIEYEELMITCKGISLGVQKNNLPVISYYVARGLKSNSVIIFKKDRNFYQPDFAVTNVQLTLGPGEVKSISLMRK